VDIKSCLLLCEPINFEKVCIIYPVDVKTYITQDDLINKLYMPYIITTDIVNEQFRNLSIFEIIMQDSEYRELLIDSIKLFCNTDKVKTSIDLIEEIRQSEMDDLKQNNKSKLILFFEKLFHKKELVKNKPKIFIDNITDMEIYIDDNSEALTKYNFDEFTKLILLIGCKQKYKPEVIPVFETPEGYERWKKYEEQRLKYQVKEDNSIASIINVVQTGTSCYIDEEIIKRWSMWKLMNTYSSIISRDSYDKQYSQYLVSGKPDAIKEHWSELLKVK